DYCNALLTGLPACVVKPLQMIQNAAARLVFNQTKRAPVTRLLIELHWLPVAARIKFKSLMLAYRVLTGTAPTYLNALVRVNVTPRMLRSSSERRLALPSVQVRQSRQIGRAVVCSSDLVLTGTAPTYLNALVRVNVTPRMLRSSSERRLALPSVQVRQSRLFSFVVPR